MKRFLLLLALLLLAVLVSLGQAVQQERYTYQRVIVSGDVRYTETYETREKDLDDQTFHTTQRRVTYIDKAQTLARLTAEKAVLVQQGQDIQDRITALSALP